MVSFFLVGLFIWGFYKGFRRGFALQAVYLGGYLFSYTLATLHYRKLASVLKMIIPFPNAQASTRMGYFSQSQTLDLDIAFYAGIAFLLIYFSCYFLVRLLAVFVYGLRFVPIFGEANKLLGGVSGFFSMFLSALIVLKLLTIIPNNSLQTVLFENRLVQAMIERIPFFSDNLQQLWVAQTIGV